MNTTHLRAFLWLHWRLRANQLTRGGVINVIFLTLFTISIAILAVTLFFGSFAFGMVGLTWVNDDIKPTVMMFIWDGLVLAFLLSWLMGLVQELQRAEALSLDKFLHLPVSLSGVFVLNYVSSVVSSLTLMLVVPAMSGFSLGLVFSEGPAMLLLIPAVAAFFLMVTALTYQFQGWIASLMINKRKRRTIVVMTTMVFVLMFQLPNLLNVFQPWKHADKGWSPEEKQQLWELTQQIGWIVNIALPPGWLPIAATGAAEGNVLAPLLATAGMAIIGTVSLWRSYRTTVRMYTGQYSSRKADTPPAPLPAVTTPTLPIEARPVGLLEKQIPWLPEQSSAVALSGFRSLTRAPEAKMLLLTPIILAFVLLGMYMHLTAELPGFVRPLLAIAGTALMLFTLIQVIGNQFGFDRSGFRVFILCPAPRDEILMGKNFAVAPIALALSALMVTMVAIFFPMRIDHLVAQLPQWLSMYLLFCMLANWMAILAPMPVASGSLKPIQPKFLSILIQMLFVFALPVVFLPTLFPLGLEAALEGLGWGLGLPIYLVLSLVLCAGVICLYRPVLRWQGQVFQLREQRILEVVATKAE